MAKPLVERELELAEEVLRDAQVLLNAGGSSRSIINRVYFTVFHASSAALIGLGFEPKTHKGTINLFWREVAQKGMCSKEAAKFLAKTFQMRGEADYEPLASFDDEDFPELLEKAESFIGEVKALITGREIGRAHV